MNPGPLLAGPLRRGYLFGPEAINPDWVRSHPDHLRDVVLDVLVTCRLQKRITEGGLRVHSASSRRGGPYRSGGDTFRTRCVPGTFTPSTMHPALFTAALLCGSAKPVQWECLPRLALSSGRTSIPLSLSIRPRERCSQSSAHVHSAENTGLELCFRTRAATSAHAFGIGQSPDCHPCVRVLRFSPALWRAGGRREFRCSDHRRRGTVLTVTVTKVFSEIREST